MPTSGSKDNPPDPLANLQKIIDAIFTIINQLFKNIVLVFGIGFLVLLFILYLFFRLFGFT